MKIRDLITIVEGRSRSTNSDEWRSAWANVYTVKAGTVLFHGTDDHEFSAEKIRGPAWFSDHKTVAHKFAKANGSDRVLSFKVLRNFDLPLILNRSEWSDFCERFGIDAHSAEDMRDSAKRARIPGWFVPDNYKPGADILIVDPRDLTPV